MSSDKAAPNWNEIEQSQKGLFYSKQLLGADLLQSWLAFAKASETHEPSNRIFDELLSRVFQAATQWMEIYQFETLELQLKGEQFFINEQRIRPKPNNIKKLKRLAKLFRERGITGLSIPRAPDRDQLRLFMWQFIRATPETKEGDLHLHGSPKFALSRLAWSFDDDQQSSVSTGDYLFDQLVRFANDLFKKLQENQPLEGKFSLEQLLYELHHLSDDDYAATFCRRTLEPSDTPLATTAAVTAWLLHGWGKALGLPPFVNVELSTCGLLFPLSVIERVANDRASNVMAHMQRLKNFIPVTELQVLALLEFSTSFGEKGIYQSGHVLAYQHIFSRMLRICALFAQLITPDRRKPAMPSSDAVQKLLSEDLGCDRNLCKLFVGWIGLSPLGSLVKMASGETAVVCSVNADLNGANRPSVLVVKGKDGEALAKPTKVDLSEVRERLGTYKHSIKEEVSSLKDSGMSPDDLKHLLSQMEQIT